MSNLAVTLVVLNLPKAVCPFNVVVSLNHKIILSLLYTANFLLLQIVMLVSEVQDMVCEAQERVVRHKGATTPSLVSLY